MFKKFSAATDVSGQTNVKSSVQRSIRSALLSQWKVDQDTLESIWPKKESVILVKCREHISIYTLHGEPLFFQHFDEPFFPTLRLVHKYPFLLPKVRIDRGAIRFLLAGAHMMCPGLTSAGGYLPPPENEIKAGTPVVLFAEGKEHAVALGVTKMSTEDMRRINKNTAVETVTYLGDDLWALQKL
ncbi:translation machinery-associated protein 20 [Steccherinum ochraceum]|uniref:Translation machinery-associated protein 20 n=1 Tax=Steccherinum ochraceum TaxID=92696 RepID=A0A4R0R4Q4_9APHY|nr:translation machinery-associated protein 20 [Steccherinum ochraceum]